MKAEPAASESPEGPPNSAVKLPGFRARNGREAPRPDVVRFEPLSGTVRDGSRCTRLRPRTAALLDYLANHPGRLISKDELLRAVWADAVVTEDSLVQCVKEIRQALGVERRDFIRTVSRRGYALLGVARPDDATASGTAQGKVWLLSPADAGGPPAGSDSPAWRRVWLKILLLVGLLAASGIAWNALRPRSAQTIPPPLSIVVLPFASLGNDAVRERYYAEGLTDDLTNDISRIPHSVVIAYATARRLGRDIGDVRRIGRDLGVRYALDGSVLRDGDEVRLNVKLFDTRDGRLLWADRFTGDRRRLVALEKQVTIGLVKRLQLTMVATDVERGLRQNASNFDAYDLALRAWWLAERRQPDAIAQARETALKSLALDPRSAFAWAMLSKTYSWDVLSRYTRLRGHSRGEWLQRAGDAARKAYALDPDMFDVQGVYAAHLMMRGRLTEAVALHERQIARNPGDPEPYHMQAITYLLLGQPRKAIALEERALEICPASSSEMNFFEVISASYSHLGQDERSLAAAEQGIALRPQAAIMHALAAAAAAHLGRHELARANIAKFRSMQPDYTIAKLRADFPSATSAFYAQREHLYEGLRKAGLP